MRVRILLPLVFCLLFLGLPAEEVVTLAVMGFTTNSDSGSDFLGESFSETMSTKLASIGQIHLFERSQFQKIAGELQLAQQNAQMFDQSTVQHVGRVVAIDYMLLGSVTQLGKTLQAEIRLINVNTGRAELARELRGGYPEDVFDLQDRIALDISDALQIRLSSLERDKITRDPTADLDAFNLYNRALSSSRLERVELLRQALKRDPEFDQARHYLAESLFSLNEGAAAQKEYALLLDRNPDDYKALYNFALLAFDSGDYQAAEEFLLRCTDFRPQDADAWYHRGLVREFGRDGSRLGEGFDMRGALHYYDAALQVNPTHLDALYARGLLSAMSATGEEDPVLQLELLKSAVDHLNRYLKVNPAAWNGSEVRANVEMLSISIEQLEEYLAD